MRMFFACAALLLAAGCSKSIDIPKAVRQEIAQFQVLVDEARGDNRLVVTFYGSPVELVRRDCIRGHGLDFYLINRAARNLVWRDSTGGEAGPDVLLDYSQLADGVVLLTQYTFDARPTLDQIVPLWLTTVTVRRDGTCCKKTEVLLTAEEGDADRIRNLCDEAAKAFERGGDNAEEEYTAPLAHLRNIAIRRPDGVRAAMDIIPSDGHFSCVKGDFAWEVEGLKKIQEGHAVPSEESHREGG